MHASLDITAIYPNLAGELPLKMHASVDITAIGPNLAGELPLQSRVGKNIWIANPKKLKYYYKIKRWLKIIQKKTELNSVFFVIV